jgi:quinol-cytochrome oxidoreductase complex cytochrome b subunit
MSLLRYVSLLMLAIWVGGLGVLAAIVAPSVFATLEAQDPANGAVAAGLVFGGVFRRFQHVAWIIGVVLGLVLWARALIGPRPRRVGLRLWTLTAMVVMTLVGGFVIAPRIDAIRQRTSGPVRNLADSDPTKIEFSRLHGASNALMLVTLALGAGLIWMESKDTP